jgi:anti-sigma factor RsiW
MAALSDEDRANLVAYLDGELDDEAARALEARLSLDPDARAEAETLRKTWELLDYLPRPEPSPTFTHRTLERLAVQRTTGPRSAVGRRWRWGALAAGWAAAVLVAVGAGLGAARLLWPRDGAAPREPAEVEDLLVRNPRVAEYRGVFEQIEDLSFLRALDDPDLFGDDEIGS